MDVAAEALRLAALGTENRAALRRREAPGRLVPAAASKPDVLLLDEPTNHLDAESVECWSSFFGGSRVRWSPSLTTVISLATPRAGSSSSTAATDPLEGNIPRAGEKEKRLEIEEKQEQRRIKSMQKGAGMGAAEPQGPPGEVEGALALREFPPTSNRRRNETQEIFIPVAERLGDA